MAKLGWTLIFWAMLCFSARAQDKQTADISIPAVEAVLEKANNAASISEADSLAHAALKMARSIRYESGIFDAISLVADISMRQSRSDDALLNYLEALRIAEKNKSGHSTDALCEKIGDLFLKEKLYENAIEYYSRLHPAVKKNYVVLEKIADAHLYNNDYELAGEIYDQIEAYYKQAHNHPRLINIYQKQINAYNTAGNYGMALLYYLRTKDIIERFGTDKERAVLYNNIGRQFIMEQKYGEAVEYLRKAELQCQYTGTGDCMDLEVLYANMGVALENQGKTKEGIEYLLRAREEVLAKKDRFSQAHLEHLIASGYFTTNDVYNALSHNDLAIKLSTSTGQPQALTAAYKTAAELYHQLYDFEKAFDYYQKYLYLMDSIRGEERNAQQHLSQQQFVLDRSEKEIKLLLAQQEIKDLALQEEEARTKQLEAENRTKALEIKRQEDELLLIKRQKEVDEATLRTKSLEALKAQQELRITEQRYAADRQQSEIGKLRQQEEKQRLELERQHALDENQARQLDLLQREKTIANLELDKQASFKRFAYGIGGLLLVIIGLVGISFWFARRANSRLKIQNIRIENQKAVIEKERHNNERLLLNILPEEVAAELKTHGEAKPRHYQSVTVVFTDFVAFTKLSAQMSPQQLIAELNDCFFEFDNICDRHNLEKIKTIGDAFMCAGGIPISNDTHPYDAVAAAREMVAFLRQRARENPDAILTQMRIGIHTGPVVAGVIGKNKFAYDIWGDAVNLAARLEEYGEAGKINISTATYDLIKSKVPCTFRGEHELHNKGPVAMYFVAD